MNQRLIVGTTVATAATLCLSGCGLNLPGSTSASGGRDGGGGGVRQTVAQVLQTVSRKTSQVSTYKARTNISSRLGGRPLRMKMAAKYQLRPRVAWSATVLMSGTPGLGGKAGAVRQVMINDTIYARIPGLSARAGGRPWLKFPASKILGGSGGAGGSAGGAALGQSQQLDPSTMTKLFLGSKDAKKVGGEAVKGVQTTHYTGTYSIKDALPNMAAKDRATMQRAGFPDQWQFDVWIDGQQLPRKVVTKTAPGSKTTMSTTSLIYDYNKPVSITAPPAGQVSEGGNALGG
jgi:hypothetical protein